MKGTVEELPSGRFRARKGLPSRDGNADAVYLPSALLDDVPPDYRASTRLLVTLWLVTRGEESTPAQSRWVVNYWHARKCQLNPTRGLATMTTVLFELEWFGDLVASFERVSGGYLVKLKEQAVYQ